jgi:N-acetylneuraminic acid mutarotase
MNAICIYKIVVVVVLLGTASVTLGAGDTWTQKADLPQARFVLSASTVNGKIYAIGGSSILHGPGLSRVDEYDPRTDTWTTKAPMPTARQWLSTSAVNGKIYAIGGTPRTFQPALSTVEEYDPATDTWVEKAPMLTSRFILSTSAVDGKIYAIGGLLRTTPSGPETPSSAVEAYDPATDTWTQKAPMPTPRVALSTSVVNGKIYAIGGIYGNGGALFRTVEEYDPATDTWTTKTPMPTARAIFLSSSVVNGIIYVIGGVRGETALSKVEAYDPAIDTWTEKTSMPEAKAMFATSVVGGKIYAIGGNNAGHGAVMSTVYEYDATPPLVVDFNGDGIVDSADVCIMVDHWYTDYPLCDIAPRPFGDGMVDVQDLTQLAEYLFQEVNDPTLIAHWALDETEGIIAADSVSENGYSDGIVMGDPLWQPADGEVNGAIQLDGVDDYIMATPVLNPADGPFSVLAWIRGGAPGQVVLSEVGGANWLSADPSEGKLMTELVPPRVGWVVPQPLVSETIITDGNWHRIGFVWDGEHRTLYVDGVIAAEDTQANLEGSNNGLYIGTGKDMTHGTYFSGLIDDVRIYNRVVSP